MLEIYLFVNPLGTKCFKSEQKVLDYINVSSKEVSFQFIPMLNMQTINNVMVEKNLDTRDLALRNDLFESIYQATLNYKAALFQGKKRGRAFLMTIQESIVQDNNCYSEELVRQVADEVGLNWDMFAEDRYSDLAKQSFKNDQKMANEMNVTMHPTIVINNIDGLDCGVSFPDADLVTISDVCNGHFNTQNGLQQNNVAPSNQLRVL
ncbi:DsbA family protein [Dellaglioa sp. BT-FLS60]